MPTLLCIQFWNDPHYPQNQGGVANGFGVRNGKSCHSNGQAVQSEDINVLPMVFTWGNCLVPMTFQVLEHFLKAKQALKYSSWNRDACLSWSLHLFKANLDSMVKMCIMYFKLGSASLGIMYLLVISFSQVIWRRETKLQSMD